MRHRQSFPRAGRGLGALPFIATAAIVWGCASSRQSVPIAPATARFSREPEEERFVDSVLARMTVSEKLGQLNQLSGGGAPTGPGGSPAGGDLVRSGAVGSVLNVIGADTMRVLQRLAVDQSRLRVPLLFALDVIHGYRTIFPVPLAEASSWDPEAAELSARVAATEASVNGIQWTFAPMVDIARDARWGRIVEGAGEDPYLGSAMAAARVRGFQGSDLRAPTSIAATAKHFAGYGAAEGGRDYNTSEISERTMREVYLPPFHAAVCAGVQTLMAGFDEIGGVPSHANRHLTTDILRGEWGFDGLVVSDWTGIGELLKHGVARDSASAGRLAIDAGVDIDMVSGIYRGHLARLVQSGELSPRVVDEAVRRVLRLKYRLGLFRDPYHSADTARARVTMLTPRMREAARRVARESIVLLKNDRALLPLRKDLRTLAVIGALADDSEAVLGNWQGQGRSADAVSVLQGIRRAVSPRTNVLVARGASPEGDDTSGVAEAVRTARRADAVVLVIGETPSMSAEAASRASIDIPGAQLRLAEAIAATGVPTVVVLMNGRPLALQWLNDHVPAILETWFLGIEAGPATADVLFGDYNPAGKLPVSFPRATGQIPIYYNHKNTGRPPVATDKFTSKYIDLPWTPLYVFGHGLSFTSFQYGRPRLGGPILRPGETLRVDVDVTNTGARPGSEVVQLYVGDEVASVTRPVRELRVFRRGTLQPGETSTVSFTLTPDALAFYDIAMQRVAQPGRVTVWIGGSSAASIEGHFQFETPDGRPLLLPERCLP
ncbi:MAG: glycoside hydrolase family 3 N-terminal domain-containing protein [Gemmatimonadaceae bacterium]